MGTVNRSAIWGGMVVLLALANYSGLIADKDAAVMFAIFPALWVASTSRGCRRTGARA
jgi:hypothetical protein